MPKELPRHINKRQQRSYSGMPYTPRQSMGFPQPGAPNERASVAWSTEDDNLLMEYRAKGFNWGQIATYFDPKSANACRKRHERLMEKKNSETYDTFKTEDLANAYMECREEMWKIMAQKLGESKWQTIETKCMEKGLKNLQTVSRGRKGSRVLASSPNSHHSGEFEDTALVHPMDQPIPPHSFNPSAPPQPSYGHHSQSQPHMSYSNVSYPIYSNNVAYSMPPPVAPTSSQILPPLSQGFTQHYSASSFNNMPRNNSHMIGASYA